MTFTCLIINAVALLGVSLGVCVCICIITLAKGLMGESAVNQQTVIALIVHWPYTARTDVDFLVLCRTLEKYCCLAQPISFESSVKTSTSLSLVNRTCLTELFLTLCSIKEVFCSCWIHWILADQSSSASIWITRLEHARTNQPPVMRKKR